MPSRRPRAPRSSEDDRPLLSEGKLDSLFDKVTSRKLWMALLSILFAAWNYHDGRLTPEQFQMAVTAAAVAYLGAEAAVDFSASWGVQREANRADAERATARALEAHAELRRMSIQNPLGTTRRVADSLASARTGFAQSGEAAQR